MALLRGVGLSCVASAIVAASQLDDACGTADQGNVCARPDAQVAQAVAKDSVLLQRNLQAAAQRRQSHNTTKDEGSMQSCCEKCGVSGFCSPQSGNCYETKNKDYYSTCSAAVPSEAVDCCASCTQDIAGFCSPHSGNCYPSQVKAYYQSCPDGGDVEPKKIRRLEAAPSSADSVRFMSYNLFGWNAFNVNKWRAANVLKKIAEWGPAVYGAQEVELGGGRGYEHVRDKVMEATKLTEIGGSQFYDTSKLEQNEQAHFALKRGYWMSMTKFTQKSTGQSFLFFNSHWKHGYGLEQAKMVANAIAEQRKKHGALPTVLVGDTNQFCRAYEQEAIKYLKGELGQSPVKFIDAIADDSGKSFTDGRNPDCRVDFILASEGQWQLVESHIDRDGMGEHGSASDHAALMAELVPISGASSLTQ